MKNSPGVDPKEKNPRRQARTERSLRGQGTAGGVLYTRAVPGYPPAYDVVNQV